MSIPRSLSFASKIVVERKASLEEISGNLTHEASGAVSVHFTVNAVGGEYLGDCNYTKYTEGNNVHFSVSCPEDRREEITEYADTVIDSVLEYIKPAI